MIRWLTLLALACASSLFAGDQHLEAIASAHHGTLVLWEEDSVSHAGVRSLDGSWTNHEIPVPIHLALAASDGEEFVVVWRDTLLRLDRNGKALGEPVVLGFWPYSIIWTGREYLMHTDAPQVLAVATVSREGVLLTPRQAVDNGPYALFLGAELATDGNGFYALWSTDVGRGSPPMPAMGLRGRKLGSGMTPLGGVTVFDTGHPMYGWSVAWDGTQYVVAWSGDEGAYVARVSAEGKVSPAQSLSGRWDWGEHAIRVQPVEGGVLLDWRSGMDSQAHLAFLRHDGALTPSLLLPHPGHSFSQMVATLPGAQAALVEEVLVDGVKRIRVTVYSRDAMPERPGAPRAEAVSHDATIELRWAAPAQTVTEYRVESSVAGGPWNETAVLPANQRSATIAKTAKSLALRVRAMNDAGAGAYSDPVSVPAGRRRAIR